MRYLDDAVAPTLLPPVDVQVRACRHALQALATPAQRGGPAPAHLPPKVPLDVGRGPAFAHAMPAAFDAADGRWVGLKWISGDPAAPPPNLGGVILLEEPGGTGLRGIVSAAGLTGARTAAVSMVGLQLAPPRTAWVEAGGPWRVAFVGGGVQAVSHRHALARTHPDATVHFVTRRPAHELPLHDGDAASGPEALARVVRAADVVITSVAFGTTGREIDASWVEPGATLVATDYATAITADMVAGLDRGGPPWAGPRTLVDDAAQWDATRAAGKLPGYGPADATLGAVALDPDRSTSLASRPVGVTVVVNHLGVAVCDLAIASVVLREAERRGVGVELPR